ncbi:MAG: hypothetical protein U0Q16_26545 [Bryobacteraceae bacterium]
MRIFAAVVLSCLPWAPCLRGQVMIGGGTTVPIRFSATLDGPIASYEAQGIGVSPSGSKVAIKLDRVEPVINNNPPNFVTVLSDWIAPTEVIFGLNERVVRQMAPGVYVIRLVFGTVDQSPPSSTSFTVSLTLIAGPAPAIRAVGDSSFTRSVIAPGGLVAIGGSNLGTLSGLLSYDELGRYPTQVAGASVTFDGVPAALLETSPGRILAMAPYSLAGKKSADVVVTRYGQKSEAFPATVEETSPEVRSIQNFVRPDYITNNEANAAARGSAVVMFVTGAGAWNPSVRDGEINMTIRRFTARPVSVTIGGRVAPVWHEPVQAVG